MDNKKSSVAIVGGGINGMFCAYYLLKKGYKVTVIDRNRKGLTSRNNAGLLQPSLAPAPEMSYTDIIKASTVGLGPVYISPRQIAKNVPWFIDALKNRKSKEGHFLIYLGQRSLELYNQFFEKEKVDADVIRGVATLFRERNDAKAFADIHGARFIGKEKIQKLGYRNFDGGVMFDKELSINPMKLFDSVKTLIKSMGAEMLLGHEARFNSKGNEITSVQVGKTKIKADNYLAASGSWLNELLKNLDYNPMIIPARGMVFLFSTGDRKIVSVPSLIEPEGIAIAQHSDNLLRATSFFEFKGIDGEFDYKRRRWMLDAVKEHISKFSSMKVIYNGYGFRPCTPDQVPVIGRIPGYSNLFIAGGQCRSGVTLAPLTGKIISSLIEGKKPSIKHLEKMSPKRFVG